MAETVVEREAGETVALRWRGRIAFAVILLLLAALVFVAGRTALWYDESNYLSIALGIKSFHVPVWFTNPDEPSRFLDSPPGLLYALSELPVELLTNPIFVRMAYSATSMLIIVVALLAYLRDDAARWLLLPATVGVAATTGYFVLETIQVRMDLGLAALSFAGLVLVAEIERGSPALAARAGLRWLLAGLFVVTFCAVLTKYQAVCLSGAIFLWGILWRRPRIVLATFVVHGAGLVCALLLIFAIGGGAGADSSLIDNLRYNLGRIFASSGSPFNPTALASIAGTVAALTGLPLGLMVAAFVTDRAACRADPLLRLCLLLALVVAAFNVVMYRMPGASNYYMAQAAVPLAYVAARSLLILARSPARAALGVTLVAVPNLLATLQMGLDVPERWSAGIPAIITGITRPDAALAVSRVLAPGLGPTDVVLLDTWEKQGRQIPYWLGRASHYGYLFDMQAAKADAALTRQGDGRVTFIVFSGNDLFQRFQQPEWITLWEYIDAHFTRVDVPDAPGWYVYRRNS